MGDKTIGTALPINGTDVGNVRTNGRITFLDAIRGAASLMVVIGHSLEAGGYENHGGQLHVNLGRIGIVAFFLVSGYVVAFSLARQSFTTFWVRRFFRLFPVYWACVGLYMVVNIPIWDGKYTLDPVTILLNILMIQGFIGAASFLWPTWTLGNELVYYGQQSLAKKVIPSFLSVHLGWVWLALFAVMAFVTRLTSHDFSAIAPLVIFTASVGMAVYLKDTQGSKSWIPLTLGFVFLVPLLGLVLQGEPSLSASTLWTATNFNLSYLLGGVLFLIFYLLRNQSMPRVLLWLGDISYELYLVHAIVLLALERGGVTGPALLIITVPISLALGYLVRRFIGVPTQRIGVKISKRLLEKTARGVEKAPFGN
jgi:peptidoglycan/LPS O-acetylase OafA/YrhL